MKFEKKTAIFIDFNDFPRNLTKNLEPPNDGYFSVLGHRSLKEGETLKDLWSYEDVARWKHDWYSQFMAEHPEYRESWGKLVSCTPEEFLEKECPLQAYLMTQLTPDDVDGAKEILVWCSF